MRYDSLLSEHGSSRDWWCQSDIVFEARPGAARSSTSPARGPPGPPSSLTDSHLTMHQTVQTIDLARLDSKERWTVTQWYIPCNLIGQRTYCYPELRRNVFTILIIPVATYRPNERDSCDTVTGRYLWETAECQVMIWHARSTNGRSSCKYY